MGLLLHIDHIFIHHAALNLSWNKADINKQTENNNKITMILSLIEVSDFKVKKRGAQEKILLFVKCTDSEHSQRVAHI